MTFSFPDIPNCDARNLVIWAKDLQHTIAASAGPFNGNLASPIKGSATLTDTQIAQLEAGKWYINIHTAANKGGEIRGQLVHAP